LYKFYIVRKRLFLLFLIICLIFFVLLSRLFYVQIFKGFQLALKAKDLWSRDIPFEAKRGAILDRNNKLLVYNISAPSCIAIPVHIKEPLITAKKLATVLDMDVQRIYKLLTQKKLLVRFPKEGRRLSEDKAREIQRLNLPGIFIVEDTKRYYPYKSFASHLLGFTGSDNQGLAGLELVYDNYLKGKRGYISFNANAKGEILPHNEEEYVEPKNGLDIVLTIDKNIQNILEREMDNVVAKYHPESVIAIAMNPQTGEILGLGNRPTFLPDSYIYTDPTVYNRNLAIWKTYEPGSTFKIITLAAALEENLVDLTEPFVDPGFIMVSGVKLNCWKRKGHGTQTYLEVVENSCNPGFVTLGQKLGKAKLFSYIKKFGFGQKTGIDLNGEASGILFKESKVGPVELATTSFGQGVAVTPIQQIAAVSAAINGGYLMKPYVVKGFRDPKTGKLVKKRNPQIKRRVISSETSKTLRFALESVVAKGTGRKAFIDGYRVGGKTGTAQVVKEGAFKNMPESKIPLIYRDNAWFVAFAPYDDPRIAVVVLVEHGGHGGFASAPIAKDIINFYLHGDKMP